MFLKNAKLTCFFGGLQQNKSMSVSFIISTIVVIACGLFLITVGLSGMIRRGIKKDLQELLKNK